MWENAALVELLERKGILTRQDVLDMIQELRRKHPQATKYNHPPQKQSAITVLTTIFQPHPSVLSMPNFPSHTN